MILVESLKTLDPVAKAQRTGWQGTYLRHQANENV
jgi:hypothetical protein